MEVEARWAATQSGEGVGTDGGHPEESRAMDRTR